MRLSEDKARRLGTLIWRERLRRWLPPVLGVLCLFGGLTLYFNWQSSHSDPTVELHPRSGTVLNVKRQTLRSAAIVHVRLDDGSEVDAFSGLGAILAPGTPVQIGEARHASGRLTYDILQRN